MLIICSKIDNLICSVTTGTCVVKCALFDAHLNVNNCITVEERQEG